MYRINRSISGKPVGTTFIPKTHTTTILGYCIYDK